MPLLDHFHPPLSEIRHWESLHSRWASAIADALNADLLPPNYFAEEQVHVGSRVEVDVGTFDQEPSPRASDRFEGGAGATAVVSAKIWVPPSADLELPAVFPDSLEVLILSKEAGPTLVAAIELVSPGNKDRGETRRAFAAKCASYLQQGIGLIVVDIVTSSTAILHNDLIDLLKLNEANHFAAKSVYASAYRPLRRKDRDQIDVWIRKFGVGDALPLLPLALDKGLVIPIDLESTYVEACQRSRLPVG
jgi:hypothetical protein